MRMRSKSNPKARQPTAVMSVLIKSAEERTPRPTPRSFATGFKKTAKAKTLMAPLPTS